MAYNDDLSDVIEQWVKLSVEQFDLEDEEDTINKLFFSFIDCVDIFNASLLKTDITVDTVRTSIVKSESLKRKFESIYYQEYLSYIENDNSETIMRLLINDFITFDSFESKWNNDLFDKMVSIYTDKLKSYVSNINSLMTNINTLNISNRLMSVIDPRYRTDEPKEMFEMFSKHKFDVDSYVNVFNCYSELIGVEKIISIIRQFHVIEFDMDMFAYPSTCSSQWDPNDVPPAFERMDEECKKVQIVIRDCELEYTRENHDSIDRLFKRQVEKLYNENCEASYKIIQNVAKILNGDDELEEVKLYTTADGVHDMNRNVYHVGGWLSDIDEKWCQNLFSFFNDVLPCFWILIDRYLDEHSPHYYKSNLSERDEIARRTGFDALTLRYDKSLIGSEKAEHSTHRRKKAKVIYVYSSDESDSLDC